MPYFFQIFTCSTRLSSTAARANQALSFPLARQFSFFIFISFFFISFSLNFLIFFSRLVLFFSPLSLFNVEKTLSRATYNIIYSINRTYALFIIIALYYYRCHYSNYHYDYELLYIEYRPRSQLLRTLCNLNRLLFHNTF